MKSWRIVLLVALVIGLGTPTARAHEIRPALLQLRQRSADTFDVMWKVPARGDLRLGLYVRLPESCEVLTEPRAMLSGEVFVERWSVRHPQALVGETIHIDGLSTTMTDVLVRIERLDGGTQIARLIPAAPSLVVEASPSQLQIAFTFVGLGIRHILEGIDHLLFVFGLLFLVRGRAMLVKTVTSFTVAHSITLALATLGYARAPGDVLNALIAMSILFLGPEIVRRQRGGTSLSIAHPWGVAFAFGLLHGFGFASGLTELGLPANEIPLALFSFNVGVELGQLGFVAVLVGVGASLRFLRCTAPAWMAAAPAYLVGTSGAYWTIQRVLAGLSPGSGA